MACLPDFYRFIRLYKSEFRLPSSILHYLRLIFVDFYQCQWALNYALYFCGSSLSNWEHTHTMDVHTCTYVYVNIHRHAVAIIFSMPDDFSHLLGIFDNRFWEFSICAFPRASVAYVVVLWPSKANACTDVSVPAKSWVNSLNLLVEHSSIILFDLLTGKGIA